MEYFGLCMKHQKDTCLSFLDLGNAAEVQRLVDVWQVSTAGTGLVLGCQHAKIAAGFGASPAALLACPQQP